MEAGSGMHKPTPCQSQRNILLQPRGPAGSAGKHLTSSDGGLPPGRRREMRRAVSHHGWQAYDNLPAGDRHGIPTADRECPGLGTRISEQVGPE